MAPPLEGVGGEATRQGRGQGRGGQASGGGHGLDPSQEIPADEDGDPGGAGGGGEGMGYHLPAGDMQPPSSFRQDTHHGIHMLEAGVMGLLQAHDVQLLLRPHTSQRVQAGRVDTREAPHIVGSDTQRVGGGLSCEPASVVWHGG